MCHTHFSKTSLTWSLGFKNLTCNVEKKIADVKFNWSADRLLYRTPLKPRHCWVLHARHVVTCYNFVASMRHWSIATSLESKQQPKLLSITQQATIIYWWEKGGWSCQYYTYTNNLPTQIPGCFSSPLLSKPWVYSCPTTYPIVANLI